MDDVIEKAVSECMSSFKEEFSSTSQLLTELDSMYVNLIESVEQFGKQNSSQFAIYLISIRVFRFIQATRNNITSGYYEVAVSLLRTIYEDTTLMSYLCNNENDAYEWIQNDKKFPHSVLREKLGMDKDLYVSLSNNYAHSQKVSSISPLYEKYGEDDFKLQVYPKFNREKAIFATRFMIQLEYMALKAFQQTFKNTHWMDSKWIQNFLELDQKYQTFLKSLEK